MFARLKSWLGRRDLQRARDARAAAFRAIEDAERRNDTRDLGRARMDLMAATTNLLRLERVL